MPWYKVFKADTLAFQGNFESKGRVQKKTPEFETFFKKGGWGQDFVQTKILQEIVTRGGVKTLHVKMFSP